MFLKRLFNLALRDGKAERNPVREVKFFKEDNERVRWLTDEEEARLRAVLGEREWPKVSFALNTGFRQANQFGLPWSDVNFETGAVTARGSKSGGHVSRADESRAPGAPPRAREPSQERLGLPKSERQVAAQCHELHVPGVRFCADARGDRELPVARPPTYLRKPSRHGRSGSEHRAGADGAQDDPHDTALRACRRRTS